MKKVFVLLLFSIGDEFFFGVYKKAEELLLKKGIIKNKFTEAQI